MGKVNEDPTTQVQNCQTKGSLGAPLSSPEASKLLRAFGRSMFSYVSDEDTGMSLFSVNLHSSKIS